MCFYHSHRWWGIKILRAGCYYFRYGQDVRSDGWQFRPVKKTGTSHKDVPAFLINKDREMKKQLIVIAIIIMIVVIITVYMFYKYGFNKAKEIAPLINPAARYI